MAESLGLSQAIFTRDNLVIREGESEQGTIALGQNLERGALVGKITKSAGTPVAGVGNTGDGTVTGFALGAKSQLGNYLLECIAEAADGGTFSVIAPDGSRLADATVGTPYINQQVEFTVNDGAEDFDVGDTFTLPVDYGSGEFILSLASAVDGSQEGKNMRILAKDADASTEAVTRILYKTGTYNENAVTFGTGHTASSVKQGLYEVGIHLESPIKAE